MSNNAPLDERWRNGEVITVSAFFFGLTAMLTGVAIIEGWPLGVAIICIPAAIVLGYESGIIPHYKWEVKRRLPSSESRGEDQ